MTALRTPFDDGFTDVAARNLAAALSALADPTRLTILALLAANGELTILDLTDRLGTLKQPTVSHHVCKLYNAGLLDMRRAAGRTYCTANREAVTYVAAALHGPDGAA